MRSRRRGIIWSDALAVAEEGDVEAVAEAPAVAEALLEGGGDSAGHLGGSRSEGHEEDVGGGPAAEAGEDGENLVGVGGAGVDELELEVLAVGAGAVEEGLDGGEVEAQAVVGGVGGRSGGGELGREAEEVDEAGGGVVVEGGVGLDGDVDYGLTWTCYRGGDRPCGACDSCLLRAKAFAEAGMEDPLVKPL